MILLGGALAVAGPWDGHLAGYEPLELGDDVPSSDDCGRCHPLEHAEWSRSRHRASWTNERMQHAYVYETMGFCVACHAPRPAQQAEIAANRTWYLAQDPRRDVAAHPVKAPEPEAADGIGCAVCHWRDGEVLATSAVPAAPHPVRVAPELGEPAFCAHCHDFAVPTEQGGRLAPGGVPMQGTTAEWTAWAAGRAEPATCATCHMPRGSHRFAGASRPPMVRRALSATAERSGDTLRLTLEARRIGHALPSGDVFRQLVVEVERAGTWGEVARLGRELAPVLDVRDGAHHMEEVRDTALRPGEPRVVRIDGPGPVDWRVRYLYTSEPALVAQLAPSEAAFVVARGRR